MLFGRKLSAVEFRDAFVDRLKATAPELRIQIESDLELEVSSEQLPEAKVHLGNRYRDYLETPKLKDRLLTDFVATVVEMMAGAKPLEMHQLTCVVKPIEWLASMEGYGSGTPLHRPLAGDLVEVIAEMRGRGLRFLFEADLPDADLDRAWKVGRDNAWDRLGRVAVDAGDDIDMITAESGLAPAVLLLPEFWTDAFPDRPASFVIVPDKDCLLVADATDAASCVRLLDILRAEADPFSSTPLIGTGGDWRAATTN